MGNFIFSVIFVRVVQTVFIMLYCVLLFACRNKSHNTVGHSSDDPTSYSDEEEENSSIEDGKHSATVDYYNPSTGYTNTYTLDVEVEDGAVIQIDFPNDGYLDDSHIDPTELDEEGKAQIEDDRGRTFDVEIEPN